MSWIKHMLLIGSISLICSTYAGDGIDDLNRSQEAYLPLSVAADSGQVKKVNSEALPRTKTIPVLIEGMEEKLVLDLHQAKPLGFYTYVPRDMRAVSNNVRFTVHSRFQGKVNPNVKIEITKMNQPSVQQADSQLQRQLKAEGFSLSTPENRRFAFAKKEYVLKKGELIGRGAVFEYNHQPYSIVYHFPPEYADGVEPRLEIILDELVWYESQYK